MPTKVQHIKQANHNRDFWQREDINSTRFLDWVLTGMFYEGVHWVEAYLGTFGEHSFTHKERSANMMRHSAQFGITFAYLELLKQESENARYRCYHHVAADVSSDIIPVLDKIRSDMPSKLNPPTSKVP
jgi:hypothetical protein